MWASQTLTLLAVGVFVGLVAGGTGWAAVDVVYAAWVLVFLVLAPAALMPLLARRVRRRRAKETP